jgi:hypothetical protein
MRMIDVVRIDDILAGLISHATSHTETRQRRRLVPAERLSSSFAQGRAWFATDIRDVCRQNAGRLATGARAKKRTKKAPGRDLRLPDDLGRFCRVKDFSPDNALIREAETLIKHGLLGL